MKFLSTTFILLTATFFSVDAAAFPLLFGKKEEQNITINDFPKWMGALDKTDDEFKSYQKKCEAGSKKFFCNIQDWLVFVETLKDKSKKEQLKAINNFANKYQYILDIDNWGVSDYWESPGEFLFKSGDCEDYAIIKYFSLKQLGFKLEDMRIVVLFDNNLQIYHSVLAVNLDNEVYILDNQLTNVTRARNIYHYNPIYSINESYWWRHL